MCIRDSFSIDTDYKADFRINGSYLSYRFSHLVELVAGTESFTGDGTSVLFIITTIDPQDVSVTIDGNSGDPVSLSQSFTGDGTTTAFTIDNDNNRDVSGITVDVDGEVVESTDYTVSDKTVTFNTAPDNGASIQIFYTASFRAVVNGRLITLSPTLSKHLSLIHI